MCLLVLSFQAHPDASVILGGNRDEQLHRQSDPPAILSTTPRVIGGRDRQAGGTWLGRNEHGMLAAITNFHDPLLPIPPEALSRGKLVLGILRQITPEAAADWIARQPLFRYRPFNLLFGNREQFFYFSSQTFTAPQRLSPGRYVLSNTALNDRSWTKVAQTQDFFEQSKHLEGEVLIQHLQAFFCDPDVSGSGIPVGRLPRDSVFVELPGYGTVSGSMLTSGGRLGERYYFAEGAAMLQARRSWALPVLLGRDSLSEGTPFQRLNFQLD